GGDGVKEFRKLLRRHRKVGVEDDQHVAAGRFKGGKHRIGLADPRLAHRFDVVLRIGGSNALDLLPGAVGRVPFDKDELETVGKARNALDGGLDIAALIARRNDDARRLGLRNCVSQRAAYGVMAQAQLVENRKRREEAINQPSEAKQAKGKQQPAFTLDWLEFG